MKFLNYFPTMKFNFSYPLNDSFDRLDKFVKFLISVDEKNMNGNYLNPIQDISMKLHGDSVLFDDISYAHFVCNLKVIQLEVVRRARIPDGFMGKPFYLLPLPDKRCNSISKDYLVPSKVLCTLYQLQIYLGKFCSSFMNRARILKLPSFHGPTSFSHGRSTRFFLGNLFTVFLSMLLFSSSRHRYLFPPSFLRSVPL